MCFSYYYIMSKQKFIWPFVIASEQIIELLFLKCTKTIVISGNRRNWRSAFKRIEKMLLINSWKELRNMFALKICIFFSTFYGKRKYFTYIYWSIVCTHYLFRMHKKCCQKPLLWILFIGWTHEDDVCPQIRYTTQFIILHKTKKYA